MVDQYLTPKESELLNHVFRYVNEHQGSEFPSNSWLGSQMFISDSGVCNLKSSLQEKGYLRKGSRLAVPTENAELYLDSLPTVVPVYISVLGEVGAGPSDSAEVPVVMHYAIDETRSDAPTLIVPNVGRKFESKVFALKVSGRSMEHEHIFEGDYVIVQRYGDLEGPKDGELIVTEYLRIDDEPHVEDEEYPLDAWLVGPVVKYYRQGETQEGQPVYHLGWQDENEQNEFIIRTHMLRPVGRVIGVYREVRH